jgi:hypothetical protein
MRQPFLNFNGLYELTCAEQGCGKIFTVDQKKYHRTLKQWGTTPKRCPECKAKKNDRLVRIEEKKRRMSSPFFALLPEERKREIIKEHI